MTTTNPIKITPEEWRIAAKVARRSIFGNSELADAWENVAKYSAAADPPTQLAKAIRAAWVDRLDWDELAHAALKFLTSTGRLVSAGGMALTAEQVEDVRAVVDSFAGMDPEFPSVQAAHRLRALFPATEPAECEFRCDEGIARAGVGVRCPACTAAIRDKEATEPAEDGCSYESFEGGRKLQCVLPRGHECFHDFVQPAPAEPAEEETKAEDESGWHWVQSAGGYYSGPACTGGYGCRSMAHYEGCLRPSLTASSPVVPAPNETGPWQTVDAIPESVTRIEDCECDVWHRCTAGWEHGGLHGPEGYAPFVAAKER